MPTVSRTFSVSPPPPKSSTISRISPTPRNGTRAPSGAPASTDGAIDQGASWHNVSKIFGVTAELTYTLDELSDRKLVFVGKNKSSTSIDTITVDAAGAGSVLTYRADLEMNGPAKLLNPVMKVVFEKLANDTEKQMTTTLNRLSAKEKK